MIETLRKEFQEQFPYWTWNQETEGDLARFLEAADSFADDGKTGTMEANLAMACKVRYSDEIDVERVSRIRIHGYQVSIQNEIVEMFQSEAVYEEIRHGHIAAALILDHQKPSGDRRLDSVVEQQTSQSFLQEHLNTLNFRCDRVGKEQQRLEYVISTYFPPDSEWTALVDKS